MDWQNALVIVAVLLALLYLARRAVRHLRRTATGGCCAADRPAPQTLVQLTRSKKRR